MLLIILLVSVVLLAGLSSILLGDRWLKITIPLSIKILIILLSCLGLILIITESSHISTGLSRQSWPITKAKITDTHIIGERAYSPEITYQYSVNGKNYTLKTDLQTPGFGRKKSRQQTSRIIIAQYPVGTEINIHYNPEHPEISFVRTGPYWNNYLILSLGYLLLWSGLVLIFGIFLHERRR